MEKSIADNWWRDIIKLRGIKGYYPTLYKISKSKFIIKQPVLEIGGGPGTFLRYLNIKSATIIDIAGKDSLVGNYKFIKKDITKKLNIKEKYKTIFLMETLEHIKNPLYLMAQVYDMLDNDGTCYISIPYTWINYERKTKDNPLNCHVCRWKDNEIKDQMEKLGFKVRFLEKRRKLKNLAFFLPHCWLVVELKKRINH